MGSSDLHRVNIANGVQEVVSLINDDDIPPQLHTYCLSCWGVQQGVVGENNKLGEGGSHDPQ